MEITRNVILDLLPLYLNGDASPDTQALVEQYLDSDPELAELAKQTTVVDVPNNHPLPQGKENQMEAYKQAQKLILQRTIVWGTIIAFVILSLLGLAFLAYFMLVSVP
jgi:hypothetical protein